LGLRTRRPPGKTRGQPDPVLKFIPKEQLVKVTLKVSQNLHASMTPMILEATLPPSDNSKTGFDLERGFLERAGLDLRGASQGEIAAAAYETVR